MTVQFARKEDGAVLLASLAACAAPGDDAQDAQDNTGIIQDNVQDSGMTIQDLVNGYAVFRLEADLSHLSENDREVVQLAKGTRRLQLKNVKGMSVLFGGG